MPELIRTCLLFAVDDGEQPRVLLGRKKTGLGAGRVVGLGGHLEAGESPSQAVIREAREEAHIEVVESDLELAGFVVFTFPHRPAWSQTVDVFVTRRWGGQPSSSIEIEPEWHPVDTLPLEAMWDDARYWLPQILDGEVISVEVTFGPDNRTVAEHSIRAEPTQEPGGRG
ncbi:8-oxo-dGTP diphosphatase [Segeticoccus rhizosphaerae]|jgi:8-oxo-dGTP diphosphatase|uniref:8-oxo-dGTP diphosphatase n=1 Tax=Segeticoccus rhizosphaerae TaxID=1104777 RepID=UPI0010BFDEF4|nr:MULTISPECIES: 8-oxo-dGTP diphosphatase [Intrasporangiaceae]